MQIRRCCTLVIATGVLSIFYLLVFNKNSAVKTRAPGPGLRSTFSMKDLNLSVVLETARDVNRRKGLVMIALINNAYVPMTLNWLCNTKHMNIHELLLLISTDDNSRTIIKKHWPDVQVVSLGTDAFSGGQTFGKAGYTRVLTVRSAVISGLLDEGIETFLFEVDALWLTNPLPSFRKLREVDFIVDPMYNHTNVYGLGILYMFPTTAAKFIFNNLTATFVEVERKLKSLTMGTEVSIEELDQPMMSNLMNNYTGIRLHILPYHEYIDGAWYMIPELRKSAPKPLMIQNNFIKGVAAKESRIQQWGHWFLNKDLSCNFDRVQKVVYR